MVKECKQEFVLIRYETKSSSSASLVHVYSNFRVILDEAKKQNSFLPSQRGCFLMKKMIHEVMSETALKS